MCCENVSFGSRIISRILPAIMYYVVTCYFHKVSYFAFYRKVAIEGSETEKALICHADADYSFLNPWHELHPYYQYRKMSWLQILHPPPPPVPDSKQGWSFFKTVFF